MLDENSGRFTLAPGLYRVDGAAPAWNVGTHQARIRNLNTNLSVILGTTAVSHAAAVDAEFALRSGEGRKNPAAGPVPAGSTSESRLTGLILVPGPQAEQFVVEHRSTHSDPRGFGIGVDFGFENHFTVLRIERLPAGGEIFQDERVD